MLSLHPPLPPLTKLPSDDTPFTHTTPTDPRHAPYALSLCGVSTTDFLNEIYRFCEVWVNERKINKKKVWTNRGGGHFHQPFSIFCKTRRNIPFELNIMHTDIIIIVVIIFIIIYLLFFFFFVLND